MVTFDDSEKLAKEMRDAPIMGVGPGFWTPGGCSSPDMPVMDYDRALVDLTAEMDELRHQLVVRTGQIEKLTQRIEVQRAEVDIVDKENWVLAAKINALKLRLDALREGSLKL